MAKKRKFDYYQKPEGTSVTDETLINDPEFVRASKILYKRQFGKSHKDTRHYQADEDVAKWGLNAMGMFNYNLTSMGITAAAIGKGSEEQKQAFLYAMDAYDSLDNFTGSGTLRFLKGTGSDPTNLISLGTLGAGFFGKQAAQQGIKAKIRSVLTTGTSLAIQGAAMGTVDNTSRQAARIAGEALNDDGTIKDSYDGAEILGSAAKGAGLNLAFGGIGYGVFKGAEIGYNQGARPLYNKVKDLIYPSKPQPQTRPTLDKEKMVDLDPELRAELETAFDGNEAVKDLTSFIDDFKQKIGKDPVGVLDNKQNYKILGEAVKVFHNRLTNLGLKDPEIGQTLFHTEFTSGQEQALAKLIDNEITNIMKLQGKVGRIFRDEGDNLNYQDRLDLLETNENLYDALAPLEESRRHLSEASGRGLGVRKTFNIKGELAKQDLKEVSIKNLEEATPEELDNLINFTSELSGEAIKAELSYKIQKVAKEIEDARKEPIGKNFKTEDEKYSVIADKLIEREALIQQHIDAKYGKPGLFHKIQRFLGESTIANVLSLASTIRNVVPSIATYFVKPVANYISSGFDPVKFRGMYATYSGQFEVFRQALKNAKLAFRYEKSILSGTSDKYLEMPPMLKKAYKNKIPALGQIRIFNRLLLATDSFYETSFYRGIIRGKYTEEAVVAGTKKGLKGKELENFIKQEVDPKIESAYSFSMDSLRAVLADGKNRGLKGKALKDWVTDQLSKNDKDLLTATDNDALTEILDMLFKRNFSGKGGDGKVGKYNISAVAKYYEGLVARHPLFRVAGQIFFRTPVRLAEFSTRLAPGLQFIVPRFRKDLNGTNGSVRQARAMTELNLSQLVIAYGMMKFIKGEAQGAPYNWVNQRQQAQNPEQDDPYTITINGKPRNIALFDPFGAPLRMLWNVMQYQVDLDLRAEQGEFVDAEKEYDLIGERIQLVFMGIMKTFRDMNLLGAPKALGDMLDEVDDADYSFGDAFFERLSSISRQFIPFQGQIKNTSYLFDPELADPSYFDEFAESIFRRQGATNFSKVYTFTGRPAEIVDWKSSFGLEFLGYPKKQKIELYKKQIEQDLRRQGKKVTKKKVDNIYRKEAIIHEYYLNAAKGAGTVFYLKPDSVMLPGVKLNTVEVTVKQFDKSLNKKVLVKGNLWDLVVQQMRDNGLTDILYDIASSKEPIGTPKGKGTGVTETRAELSELKKDSIEDVLSRIVTNKKATITTKETQTGSDLIRMLEWYQETREDNKENTIPPLKINPRDYKQQ